MSAIFEHMSYFLYVNNFRGFQNTCIPITDVSFLVGENSAGKTSIMSAIKILSGPRFWLDNWSIDPGVGLRHFADIVSAHSQDRSSFQIGYAAQIEKKGKHDNGVVGWLLTFREHKGQPRLARYTYHQGAQTISIEIGTSISFKFSESLSQGNPEQLLKEMSTEWVREHKTIANGYEKLPIPRDFVSPLPLAVLLALILERKRTAKGDPQGLHSMRVSFGPQSLTWFAPIRTEPKRTYDELAINFSPVGGHTPYLIRTMLSSRKQASALRSFIEKVGKESGLFQDVRIQNFGRGANARFELDIVIDDFPFNVMNVGYGVSQALPIMIEFLARPEHTFFAVQEPEIHLHPRAQAALGDVIFEMAAANRKQFLVETHSDFIIDRFRLNYRKGRGAKPKGQILYFERRDRQNTVTSLPIGPMGELPPNQPDGYRRFFVREQMDLLGI